jgi:Formate hydrogenlyase subunit 3/Multisubunit Na+/H+ antiporter, MnhD subunit
MVVFDHKHEQSVRAGTIYLIMTHIGTASLMAAFFILYAHAGSFDFSAIKQAAVATPLPTRNIVFLLLLFGFATKAGVVPVHIWLPYAHPQAPSHISSIMSGVMIKTAIYGMIRFLIMLLGPGPAWWGVLILILAGISCLVGVIYALMDHDIKRLLAYHSVENIGIILLGIGAAMLFNEKGLVSIAALGMCAGLYHLINHALFKGLLFLCAGSVLKATGIRDMEKMGGLIKGMPCTAAFFLIGAMGISALPPLNGFVSEWLTFQAFFAGILQSQGWIKLFMFLCVATLALTSGLAAACFVKAFGITFLAMPRSQHAEQAKEVSWSLKLGMGFLAVMVILFGVGAGVIAPSIYRVAQNVFGVPESAFSFQWFSLNISADQTISISPFIIAALLLFFSFGILGWFLFGSRKKTVPYNTWDCGYYALDSRTEYTATGFSKPFRIAFSFFLRPYHESKKLWDSFYYVRSFTYETHTTPIFERHVYEPLLKFIYAIALKVRKIQPGIINIYLLYIFLTMVLLVVITGMFNL